MLHYLGTSGVKARGRHWVRSCRCLIDKKAAFPLGSLACWVRLPAWSAFPRGPPFFWSGTGRFPVQPDFGPSSAAWLSVPWGRPARQIRQTPQRARRASCFLCLTRLSSAGFLGLSGKWPTRLVALPDSRNEKPQSPDFEGSRIARGMRASLSTQNLREAVRRATIYRAALDCRCGHAVYQQRRSIEDRVLGADGPECRKIARFFGSSDRQLGGIARTL